VAYLMVSILDCLVWFDLVSCLVWYDLFGSRVCSCWLEKKKNCEREAELCLYPL
jgi:hypothetical protein